MRPQKYHTVALFMYKMPSSMHESWPVPSKALVTPIGGFSCTDPECPLGAQASLGRCDYKIDIHRFWVYMNTHGYISAYWCTWVCTCTWVYTYMCKRVYMYVWVCMCLIVMCEWVCECICSTWVYMCDLHKYLISHVHAKFVIELFSINVIEIILCKWL